VTSPAAVLARATKAVPATKYAVSVAGLAAAVAITASFKLGIAVAILGVIVMLALMVGLLLLSAGISAKTGIVEGPAVFLIWGFAILILSTAFLTMTVSFFAWPRAWAAIIGPSFASPGSLVATSATARTLPAKDSSYSSYKLDVFWCEGAVGAEDFARSIEARLSGELAFAALRVRRLSAASTTQPWAAGYEIRVGPDGSEDAVGRRLQGRLAQDFAEHEFSGWAALKNTPNYLSVFVCPGTPILGYLSTRTRRF